MTALDRLNMSYETCAVALLDNDALGEIFSACVGLDSLEGWDSTSTRAHTTLDTQRAPWVLGQVCQSWRRIVLSSPLLWTSLDISLPDGSERSAACSLFLLELYLSRSAACPLSVSLRSSTRLQKSPSFLHSLLSTSSRWHTLMIDIPISSYETLAGLTGVLDSLKVLHIRLPHQSKSQAVRDFANLRDGIRLFRFCHNLEQLSLENIPFPRDIFHLPWAKIQCLSIYSSSTLVSNPATLRALHGLQNLTSCSLECRFVTECRNLKHLTLPFLQSMTLSSAERHYDAELVDDSGMEIVQMLSWVTLPALKRLQLRQKSKMEFSEDRLVTAIIQMIRRSHCEIRELQLDLHPSLSEAGIISILKEISPSLEKLCFHPGSRHDPNDHKVMAELLWRVRRSKVIE